MCVSICVCVQSFVSLCVSINKKSKTYKKVLKVRPILHKKTKNMCACVRLFVVLKTWYVYAFSRLSLCVCMYGPLLIVGDSRIASHAYPWPAPGG